MQIRRGTSVQNQLLQATSRFDGAEVVLHHFSSVPHGAYPSSGVIRDLEGNRYGTTNGRWRDALRRRDSRPRRPALRGDRFRRASKRGRGVRGQAIGVVPATGTNAKGGAHPLLPSPPT